MVLAWIPLFVQMRLYSLRPMTHFGEPISAQKPSGRPCLDIFINLEAYM